MVLFYLFLIVFSYWAGTKGLIGRLIPQNPLIVAIEAEVAAFRANLVQQFTTNLKQPTPSPAPATPPASVGP